MEFSYLKKYEPKLIAEMNNRGYAVTYINRHRTVIAQIVSNAPENSWQSYADIFDWYNKMYQSPTYLHEIRAVIENLEGFHLYGRFPGEKKTGSLCLNRSSYEKLNEEYKNLVDFYSDVLSEKKLKESTCYSALHKSSSFLFDLQSYGEEHLSDVTEEGVIHCFYRDGVHIRGASCSTKIRNMFISCEGFDANCIRIASYVPMLRHARKNIQYLNPEEICSLRSVIDDEDSDLSYKDRAIGMLLLYTGIRGCDIAHLTVDSIAWTEDVIRFSQQKTGHIVELPLIPIVGNAIYDYILKERPQNECDRLFLGNFAPHHGLTTDGIGTAVRRLMTAAEIRQKQGDRCGTHIFRHRFVTSLLEKEIPAPVISSALGHTSPKSLEPYLNADIEHLRSCSLSIERFPTVKGVFSDD